jgi:exopolysaccharide biosynthesis polyprenyl glycosylphosphotransferase
MSRSAIPRSVETEADDRIDDVVDDSVDEVLVIGDAVDVEHVRAPDPVERERPFPLDGDGVRTTIRVRRRAARTVTSLALIGGVAVAPAVALRLSPVPISGPAAVHVGTATVIWLAVAGAFGLLSSRRLRIGGTIARAVGSALTLAGILSVLGASGDGADLAVFVAALALATAVIRSSWGWIVRRLRLRGALAMRTLVIGHSSDLVDIGPMMSWSESDLAPVGYVTLDGGPHHLNGLPHVGSIGSIHDAIDALDADCLAVATPAIAERDLADLRRIARRRGLAFHVVTRTPDSRPSRISVQPLGAGVAVEVRPARLTGVQNAAKRAVDVALGSLVLLVSAPVMGVIAIVIKTTSAGPVLFRQTRVTRAGRTFTIIKFRTMVHDVEEVLRARAIDDSQPFFKPHVYDILTPVGAFLRKTSLDELPQLWNVVRGDMSLVGPRPLPLQQVEANPELLGPRHDVRAGVTGWWQVNGRSDVSPEEAVGHDVFYIENWSLGLDLAIMGRTFGALLKRRGAY